MCTLQVYGIMPLTDNEAATLYARLSTMQLKYYDFLYRLTCTEQYIIVRTHGYTCIGMYRMCTCTCIHVHVYMCMYMHLSLTCTCNMIHSCAMSTFVSARDEKAFSDRD